MKVNDICNIPPIRESVDSWSNLPENFERYELMISDSEFPEEVIGNSDAYIDMLDSSNIEKVVLHGEDAETNLGFAISNQNLADFAGDYPDRIFPFSGYDPHKGYEAVEKLEKAFKDLDMRGVIIEPFTSELPSNHKKYYPAYSKCVEHDAIAWIHTSVQYTKHTPLFNEHPRHIDEIASDFPELKIIIGHGGWPWVNKIVALMMKYPNVYAGISAWKPKYIAKSGSGWEPLIHYGNSVLKDRVIFGTDWPGFGSHKSLIQEFNETIGSKLKEESRKKWLYENLNQLLVG